MSFLKRVLGKKAAQGPIAAEGEWLLAQACERAYYRLAEGEIEDVYRASLTGGLFASATVLAADDDYRALWGHGTQPRATALLEVWASTLAALRLPWKSDREEVVRGVGMGLSTILGTEPGIGRDALDTFLYHMERNETYAFCILDARVMQALLGNEIDFRQFAHSNFSHAELLETHPELRDANKSPSSSVRIWSILMPVTVDALNVAKEHFQQLSK